MTSENHCTQAALCAALLDPGLPCPPGLVAWNGSDPTPRLGVYRNNVLSSLIDALAQTFPVVQELVGAPFFRAMAAVFVRKAPPRSRILACYGEAFPAFIEEFEPARSVPYLADVARLEMSRVRAYHAADAEPVSATVLNAALAGGDRIGELRIVCHPSVAIVASNFAVASLWSAHQGEGDMGNIDPGVAEACLVLRDGLEVLVMRLSPGSAEFVAAILQGLSLSDAAGAAISAEIGFDLPATLGLLTGRGAITSVHFPEDDT